jgi:hypothetical protein
MVRSIKSMVVEVGGAELNRPKYFLLLKTMKLARIIDMRCVIILHQSTGQKLIGRSPILGIVSKKGSSCNLHAIDPENEKLPS